MPGSRSQNHRYVDLEGRVMHMAAFALLAFLVLWGRLWYVQIVRGEYYLDRSENNRIHDLKLKAPRGLIYGRDGKTLLADNRPSCDIYIIPKACEQDGDVDAVAEHLGDLLGVDAIELVDRIHANRRFPFEQILVKRDVSKSELIRVEEFSYVLPGVVTAVRPQRRYLNGVVAGQLLGYLNEARRDEVESGKYSNGDLKGRAGLEWQYEDRLLGVDGELRTIKYAKDPSPQTRTDLSGRQYFDVDSLGNPLEQESRTPAVRGDSLYLTLDVELQEKAEQALGDKVGAVSILNADTGEVLALASTPGYDPQAFIARARGYERWEILNSKPNCLQNRNFWMRYPPGSLFKILVALAALEEGVIDSDTSYTCYGVLERAGTRKRCHSKVGHGSSALVNAIAYSCDIYFYEVGLELGVDRISDWARRFGFGRKTGIDLPGEVPGLVPSREWKQEAFSSSEPWDRKWYPAETMDFAIGQGYLSVTPLQCCVLMAAVINGGRVVRPYLNKDLGPDVSEPLVSESSLKLVQEGMLQCIEKKTYPRGTGRRIRTDGVTILGKTGTAQVASMKHYEHLEEEEIPYQLRSHAWFMAALPDHDPPVAICVLIEHGLHGSTVAVPVCKEIVDFMTSGDVEQGTMVSAMANSE